MLLQVNSGDRPTLEDVRACIWKKKKKKQLTIPLVLSQAIGLETFERRLQLVQPRSAARK